MKNKQIIMKTKLVLLLLFLVSFQSFSQTNDEKAMIAYKSANDEFKKGNYEECTTYLLSAIDNLGKTNIRIQYMLSKAYYKLNNYEQTQIEIENYKNLNGPKDDGYFEIQTLSTEVNEQILKQKKEEQLEKADEAAWSSARITNTKDAYQQYINKFPNGDFLYKAKEMVAWQNAISKKTSNGFKEYLSGYPNGSFIKQAEEEACYLKSVESNYIGDTELYKKTYPNGKYIINTTNTLRISYFNIAEGYFLKKDYENATVFYNKYTNKFPDGDKYNQSINKIQQIKQIAENKIEYDKLIDQANNYHYSAEESRSVGKQLLGWGSLGVVAGSVMLFSSPVSSDIYELNLVQFIGGLVGVFGLSCVITSCVSSLPDASKDSEMEKRLREEAKKYLTIRPVYIDNNICLNFTLKF